MKTTIPLLLFALLFIITINCNAQSKTSDQFKDYDMFSAGVGAGLDYGGLGVNLLAYKDEKLGGFVGLGYNIVGVGVNAGIKYRFLKEESKSRVIPFVTAMYGYNGVIKVTSSASGGFSSSNTIYEEIFYGPSFGFGLDKKRYEYNMGYWSFEVIVPIRPQSFQKQIDLLKKQGANITQPLPIALSIGYKFIIK